jgi:hypothetical protein
LAKKRLKYHNPVLSQTKVIRDEWNRRNEARRCLLNQLASQQANDGGLKLTRAEALAAIPELRQVWRATSTERLQQALDRVQSALLRVLESSDPRQRLRAARLMLRTKQGRERGFIRT